MRGTTLDDFQGAVELLATKIEQLTEGIKDLPPEDQKKAMSLVAALTKAANTSGLKSHDNVLDGDEISGLQEDVTDEDLITFLGDEAVLE